MKAGWDTMKDAKGKEYQPDPNRIALQKRSLDREKYPALFKMLHELWQGWLYGMLNFYWLQQDITPNQHINQDGKKEFWQSVRESAERGKYITRNYRIWHRNRILLHCLGLIYVRQPNPNAEYLSSIELRSLEYFYMNRAKTGDMNQKPVSYITTEIWKLDMVDYSESQAQKWLNNPQPVQYMTKETIIKVFGAELANQVYGDERGISENSKNAKKVITKIIKNSVKRNGYITKEQVISRSKKRLSKLWANKAWTIHSKDVLDEIGYEYHRPTNSDKVKFSIRVNNNKWIITQRQENKMVD